METNEKEIFTDGVNVAEERKFLIRTDEYSIGEDGKIDSTVPLTNICYELALQLQRLKEENEKLKAYVKQFEESSMIIHKIKQIGEIPIIAEKINEVINADV